ncbi:MAG: FAD-dependent oxidoreductase [Burkholderiales bacterium]
MSTPLPHTPAPPRTLNIAVIGAGIAGVTTAFELAADGHRVTVYDRRESVGAEGSFANTGLLSPGCVSPASAPGLRPWLLRGLVGHESALRWRPGASLAQWRWLARWWRACGTSHAADVRTLVGLARYSQQRLALLTEQLELDYERSSGVLLLLRDEREFRPSRRHVLMLRELGVEAAELTPEQCREIEPGLGEDAVLAGGVHLSGDGVGNCRQFAYQLRDAAVASGRVSFRFDTAVQSVRPEGSQVHLRLAPAGPDPAWQTQTSKTAPLADQPAVAHDAVVLCTGASAGALLKPLGWSLPLLPVYGHSLTLPLRLDGRAPRSAVVDAQAGVAIGRLGGRIRITGGYGLGEVGAEPSEEALRPLYAALDRWFPYAANRNQVQVWTGARPMLPEGPPIIGSAPGTAGTVWLNVGHGAHGWTLACGSARLLADQLGGRTTALDASPFAAVRWLRKGRR